MASSTTPRGPSGLGHLSFLRQIVRNYAEADLQLFCDYGDVVRVRMPTPMLLFFRPADVRHILRGNVLNYPKSTEYDLLRPILGDGIFVSEGQLWTRQRRLLAPEFRPQTVARFLPLMIESAQRLFAQWDRRGDDEPIDVSAEMMRLTLWIVGRTMFKNDFQDEAEIIAHSLEVCLAHAKRRLMSMGLYKSWLPTRANREAADAARALDETILHIIEDTRSSGRDGHDVISSMGRARDPDTGEGMSDQQMLDETKSLILAGHETTSLVLSWGLYLLDRHPEVTARLVEEAAQVLGDRTPTAEDIPRLVYTRMVILEIMRLYPPVPVLSRSAVEDDEIGGVPVHAGEIVAVAPYVTHRHPEYWDEPERFNPERFEDEGTIEPYSYMPFLLGRRACLGEHFAMLEGVLLLAMLVRHYQFERVDDEPLDARPMITLRLARPLMMRVRPRPARSAAR